MDEVSEQAEQNGAAAMPAEPKKRRRVANGDQAAPKATKAPKKQSPLKEAAKAEPKLAAVDKKIAGAQEQMSKLIKEREKIVKALSTEARGHLGLGE